MKRTYFALYTSVFCLIGIPAIFLVVSILTNEWLFFLFSLIPALLSGITGLVHSLNQLKKEK